MICGFTIKIAYFHAPGSGNGAIVAGQSRMQIAARGVIVDVHHIREATPAEPPPAGPYVSSPPGRMGKPVGGMRRFRKKAELPAGMPYAILTAGLAPQPDKKTGRVPTEQDMARWQRVRPVMNEILQGKGDLPRSRRTRSW